MSRPARPRFLLRKFATTSERFLIARSTVSRRIALRGGEQPMLPWLALTYTAARLGFEAQNAAAFRLLRLGRGITKTAADEIVPEAIVPLADTAAGAG